ncbi:MAG: hypothetical protein IJZ04_02265 [Clostridia bacterium]|nr:hypothetical protein [Clostridia bacterium]
MPQQKYSYFEIIKPSKSALELIVKQNPEPSQERTNVLYEIGNATYKIRKKQPRKLGCFFYTADIQP